MADLPAVVSLGAGVQSTVLLFMAAEGKFDKMPRLAVFADTGWGPEAVYTHLEWVEAELSDYIEFARVSAGNLRDDLVGFARGTGKRYASPPLFIEGQKGQGRLRRQCTREYKIQPIERELRRRGFGGRGMKAQRVEQWLGISLDEVERMKPSRTPWVETRWPLIERRISRADCLRWWREHFPNKPLVKSACIGCPFHSGQVWAQIKQRQDDWRDVVRVDRQIRRLPHLEGDAYLHRQRVPISRAKLPEPMSEEALLLDGENFDEECEGHCGV